jgi:exopolysaccharide biosynthesis polyprenyl glycosylphosphotransferase
MSFSLQPIWRWLKFAEVVGVSRAPVRGFSVEVTTPDASSRFRPSASPRKNGHRPAPSSQIAGSRWVQVFYALIDLLLVGANAMIAFSLRFSSSFPREVFHDYRESGPVLSLTHYAAFLMLYAALTLLFCQSQSLYRTVRTRTAMDESFAVFKAVFLATLLLSAFVYLSGFKIVSRLVVGYAAALNVLTFIAWRLWKRKILVRRAEQGIGMRNVLIIGAGRVGQALAEHLEANRLLGYSFMGFLDSNHSSHPKMLGKIEDLSRIARTEFADEIFITIPSERELVKNVAVEARQHRLNVKVVPDLYDGLGWDAPINHIGDFPVMELHWEPIPAFGLFIKRLIDIVGSSLGLILLSPILAAIGIAIRLDSPGAAVYCSQRVGKKGRRFACYKFRTMGADADAVKHQLRHLNERKGPFFKIANDPRITRLGRWLRKYSLDELPQLWNVLKGEMSLVGPRPPVPEECEDYRPEYLRRLDVKPGVTGLWQVYARKHPSFEKTLSLDLRYIERWTLWLDIKILLKTLPIVINGSGS